MLFAAAAPGEEEAPASDAAARAMCRKRQRARRLDWAGLLRKTYAVDVFYCPRCGGRRRVLAYHTQGSVIPQKVSENSFRRLALHESPHESSDTFPGPARRVDTAHLRKRCDQKPALRNYTEMRVRPSSHQVVHG